MPERPLRVLFVAPDCNPKWHSLPALVANYYRALTRVADVTLATQIRNEENLAPFVPAGAEVTYLDTESVAAPVFWLTEKLVPDPNQAMTLRVALRYPSSMVFERAVWRRFQPELDAGAFDVVHRASPMSPVVPSPLMTWSPVPGVLGPVLGALKWPGTFQREMRREREWLNYLRPAHKLLPYYRSGYRHAAAILAGYPHTVSDLPPENRDRIIEFSEGGVTTGDFPERTHAPFERATVLFVGRMVPFKQPEVLVRAFEASPLLRRHRLVMVGDGPELPRLRALVEDAGLEDCVTLTGALPFDEVMSHMYAAQVFGFPSIREQGGGVIHLAAMASVPSVVVRYGGPAYRVPEGTGVRVPLGSFEELVRAFRHELEALVGDPERIARLGHAARAYTARVYDWDRKARKTLEIYEWVLGRRREKPDFYA